MSFRFLIITQDLRTSGTSEGIVSRSFISNLKKSYPDSRIDLKYMRSHTGNDFLNLLPIDLIDVYTFDLKPAFFTKWVNRITRRVFSFDFYDYVLSKEISAEINTIDDTLYDFIFVRSTGLKFEVIRALKYVQFCNKIIANFHDPYPLSWYPESNKLFDWYDFGRLKEMRQILNNVKLVTTPSHLLSHDLNYLYQLNKKIVTIPHQFCPEVFPQECVKPKINKKKKITFCYYGALQFGRDITPFLNAYCDLLNQNELIRNSTEVIIRLKSNQIFGLKKKYSAFTNIRILESIDFPSSLKEQKELADINILIDNGGGYSNILVGKAPILDWINKPIIFITPLKSELRKVLHKEAYIASNCIENDNFIMLSQVFDDLFNGKIKPSNFGEYFSQTHFTNIINEITNDARKLASSISH